MCVSSTSESNLYHPLYSTFNHQQESPSPNLRGQSLHRRRLSKQAKAKGRMRMLNTEIEMNNLKLYLDNKRIIEENDKLRKKAALLHHENRALHTQLHTYLTHPNITHNNF